MISPFQKNGKDLHLIPVPLCSPGENPDYGKNPTCPVRNFPEDSESTKDWLIFFSTLFLGYGT